MSNFNFKRTKNLVTISNPHGTLGFDLNNKAEVENLIDSLGNVLMDVISSKKAIEQQLTKGVTEYEYKAHSGLANDALTSIPSKPASILKKGMRHCPHSLQGEYLKTVTSAVSSIYREISSALLQNDGDSTLIAKSCLAKSASIENDVALIKSDLDTPFETMLKAQAEAKWKNENMKAAAVVAENKTKNVLGEISPEVLELAAKIQASRNDKFNKQEELNKAINKANAVANS